MQARPTVLQKMLLAVCLSTACGGQSPTAPDAVETCAGYPEWSTSLYVLPYPAGATYRVTQANCSPPGNGHRGSERYGYDFDMAIATLVTAARGGTVVHVEARHFDGQIGATGLDNYIVIRHDDDTHGLYGHMTHDGAAVQEGTRVATGERLGSSGNTGNTNNVPHLHFSVHACDPVTGGSTACPTQPITFRNTDPNPQGLQRDWDYKASE
jgi:murein DD-endopeptidase MepM/ murein hydrolase activator NlpD